jgi:hypothetical protein
MMKHKTLLLPAASFVLLFVGCEAEGRETDKGGDPARTPGRLDQGADWTRMKKDEFVAALNDRLATIDRKLDNASEEAKEGLREKRKEVGQQLDKIRTASEDSWVDMRASLLEGVRSIERTLEGSDGGK